MGSCIVTARYNQRLDIYKQTVTRDPDTLQERRTWDYLKTLMCQARGVVSEGIRTVGSTEDYRYSDRTYFDEDWIKIRTSEQISKRALIYNIRTLNDVTGWIDLETGKPIVFEVLGSQPIPDPFGRVQEFETLAVKKQDSIGELVDIGES